MRHTSEGDLRKLQITSKSVRARGVIQGLPPLLNSRVLESAHTMLW